MTVACLQPDVWRSSAVTTDRCLLCVNTKGGIHEPGSRSTSSVHGRPQTDGTQTPASGLRSPTRVCFKTDCGVGDSTPTFLVASSTDAAKRTFQITSLQAFSKYSVAYVYLNGSMLSLPSSPPLFLTVAWCWFCACFQRNDLNSLGATLLWEGLSGGARV